MPSPDRIRAGKGIRISRTGQVYVVSSTVEATAAASGGTARWLPLGTVVTATSNVITLDEYLSLYHGAPIRWMRDGDDYYSYAAVISADDVNETLTCIGPPLAEGDVLEYDDLGLSAQVQLFIPGEYGSATGSGRLWAASSQRFAWLLPPGAVVGFRMVHGNDATTSQATMNVSVDGDYVSTSGVTLNGTDWVTSGADDIDNLENSIQYGSAIEIGCITASVGATQAEDLTVEILVVSE